MGRLKSSDMYQNVLEVFQSRGELDIIAGHSIGGNVALEFQKNYADKTKDGEIYGAPVFD